MGVIADSQGYPNYTTAASPAFSTMLAAVKDAIAPKTVMSFTTAASRDSTIILAARVKGMTAFLQDSNTLTVWNGTAWVTVVTRTTPLVDSGVISLLSGVWQSYSGGYEEPTWRRDFTGRVYLSGVVRYISSDVTVQPTELFDRYLNNVLPTNARPTFTIAQTAISGWTGANTLARISVATTGRIHFAPASGTGAWILTAGIAFFISLDGISYMGA